MEEEEGVVVVVPNGPLGCSRPFRVAQATRKQHDAQTVLRMLYHVPRGIASAIFPSLCAYMACSIRAASVERCGLS